MKKAKYLFPSLLLLSLVISHTGNAQTYISGGIFANTTWTLANSPYIITDSVVVFPNVTLTINGGVVVKFEDNTCLEIRQGTLIAHGILDAGGPITFTSNSGTPHPGSWASIFLNGAPATGFSSFYNCNFYYATFGIYDPDYFNPPPDHTTISNSTFQNNITGISISSMGPVKIDSCMLINNGTAITSYQDLGTNVTLNHSVIKNNNTGVNGIGVTMQNCLVQSNATGLSLSYYDTILYNVIINNGIGYVNPGDPGGFYMGVNLLEYNSIAYNNVGVLLDQAGDSFRCNSIYGDTTWDLQINSSASSSITKNYWGTTDSAVIQSHIYDAHNDVSFGLAYFTPFESSQCIGVPSTTLSVPNTQSGSFDIYPNPASDILNVISPENNFNTDIAVYNMLGEKMILLNTCGQNSQVDISHLLPGNYIIEAISNNHINRKIFTKM